LVVAAAATPLVPDLPASPATFSGRNGQLFYSNFGPSGGERAYTVAPTGGRGRLLRGVNGADAAWSRNGRRLVFARASVGIFLEHSDGTACAS
jgi:hypothetical protein